MLMLMKFMYLNCRLKGIFKCMILTAVRATQEVVRKAWKIVTLT